MSYTKIQDGERTIYEMGNATGAEAKALIFDLQQATANPDTVVFRTYVGEYTLREIIRYVHGRG